MFNPLGNHLRQETVRLSVSTTGHDRGHFVDKSQTKHKVCRKDMKSCSSVGQFPDRKLEREGGVMGGMGGMGGMGVMGGMGGMGVRGSSCGHQTLDNLI